jgi:hypothetical protein
MFLEEARLRQLSHENLKNLESPLVGARRHSE